MTQVLVDWSETRQQSIPTLLEVIYNDLHKIAQGYMRRERPDHTLQTTALVNEACFRVLQGGPFRWKDRKHLFCIMAQTMRRVLIDHARSHYSEKHGSAQRKISLDEIIALAYTGEKSPELIAIDQALKKLNTLNTRQARVVDLRFFAGLTIEETAAVLGVSPETVKLDWRFAKAWLQREIAQTA
jgi:RNA polymerase sigma factor (TIGR02999 family)